MHKSFTPKGRRSRQAPTSRSGAAAGARYELQRLEPRVLLAFSANINFQPATAPPVAGYHVDGGAPYAAQAGTGLTYGWNRSNTRNAQDRNNPDSPSQLHDTLIQMQGGGNFTWELAVPDGTYNVRLVAGDPDVFTGATYRINVEGVQAVNAVPTSADRWAEGTVTVAVTDGRLTVSNAGGAKNNRINFIEVADAPPAAPTEAAVTSALPTRVDLRWADNSDNESGFRIEQSTGGGAFAEVAAVGANVTTYAATNLTPGTGYSFRVLAYNDGGTSAYSNTAAVTTPLPTPAALTASAASSTTRVSLAWGDVAGEAGYRVTRSTDGVNWSLAGTTAADATAFQENAPLSGAAYTYRVVAFNSAAESAPASAAVTTADFHLFNTMLFAERPDLTGHGLENMLIGYEYYLLTPDYSTAIEAHVKELAQQAYQSGQKFLLDIESWPLDSRFHSTDEVKANLRKLIQVVDWAHEGRPGLEVSLYNTLHPTGDLGDLSGLQRAGDVWRGIDPNTGAYDASHDLIRRLDFLAPSIYANDTEPEKWWRKADVQLAEAVRLGEPRQVGTATLDRLPSYPFIAMYYDTRTPGAVTTALPADYWQMILAATRETADGAIIWGGYQATWDEAAPWWEATQRFLAQGTAAPAAPSGLAVNGVGMYLSWADNASGESGFAVERSTDGVNFKRVAMLPADRTSWKDDLFQAGVHYTYRVRALTGPAQSAASNTAAATAMRDGLAVIEAETYDASWRDTNYGLGIAMNNGDWFKYSSVQLGSGVNQFVVRVEVPPQDEAQYIEVRLDSLHGPLVGVMDLAPTAGWGDAVLQTTISHISGLHDVYLVVSGGDPAQTCGLGWFKFAYNAPPAPPTKLAATPSLRRMELAWTDNSGDETGFEIQRSADGQPFTTIATVTTDPDRPSNFGSYTDTAFDPAASAFTTYRYRARSYNAHGSSDWSAVLDAGYAAANVALNRPATQAGVEYDGFAYKAVDGNTDGIYWNGSVTFTTLGYVDPWWEVDLGEVRPVAGIEVWNRSDGSSSRLSNFYVFVSDEPFTSTSLAETRAQPGVTEYFVAGEAGFPTLLEVGRTARYVRIQLPGTEPLTLAEVRVLG